MGVAGDSYIDANDYVVTQFLEEVIATEADWLGRPIVEENLLTGAKSEFEYQDGRHDAPTKVTEWINRGSQNGTSFTEQLALTSVLAYDHTGQVLMTKSGSLPAVVSAYDELGFLTDNVVLAQHGAEWVFVTDPAGNVVETTETRKQQGANNVSLKEKFTTKSKFDQQGRLRELVQPVTADYQPDVNGLTLTTRTRRTRIDYGVLFPDSSPFAMSGNAARLQESIWVEDIAVTLDLSIPLVPVPVETVSFLEATERFSDGLGRTALEIGAMGAETYYDYDAAGNLELVDFYPTDDDSTLPARQTRYKYDPLGRLRITEYVDTSTNPAQVKYFDYVDYYDTEFWNVISAANLPGKPADYDTLQEKNSLRLSSTRVRQDTQGKPIVVQQPYAGSYSDLTAAHSGSPPAGSTKDAATTLYAYSYFADQRLMAVSSRAAPGELPFDSTTNNVVFAMVAPPAGGSVPAAKMDNDHQDNRVARQVLNTAGQGVLTADRRGDRSGPIGVQDDNGTVTFVDGHTASPFFRRQHAYLDDNGRVKYSYNALSQPTLFTYDDQVTGTGLVVSVTGPTNANSPQQIQTNYYSSAGHRVELTNAEGGRIRWKYDGLGRPLHEALRTERLNSQNLPDGYHDVLRHWEYVGLSTTYTDRNGVRLVSTQDLTNRTVTEQIVSQAGLSQGQAGYNPLFDTDGDGLTEANVSHQRTTTVHSDGSVKKIEEAWSGGLLDGDGSFVEYVYDSFSRPVSVTQGQTFLGHVAPRSRIITKYDVNLIPSYESERRNKSELYLDTSNNGEDNFVKVLENAYYFDRLGRLMGIQQYIDLGASAAQLWKGGAAPAYKGVHFEYNTGGQRTKIARMDPDFAVQLSYTSFTHQPDGQLEEMIHYVRPGAQSTPHAIYQTEYDERGLLSERNVWMHNNGAELGDNQFLSFRYDAQGRLHKLGVKDLPTPQTTQWTEFSYTASGHQKVNPEDVIGHGGRLYYEKEFNGHHWLHYDQEGNLIQEKYVDDDDTWPTDLIWDPRGQLVSVRTFNLVNTHTRDWSAYDVLGRPMGVKFETGTVQENQSIDWTTDSWRLFVYDGPNVVLELDLADGDRILRNFFNGPAPGEVFAVDQMDENGQTVWTFSDLSGTIRSYGTVDQNNNWQFMRRDFDEWGVASAPQGTTSGALGQAPLIWQGRLQLHPKLGAYHIDGRWYEPSKRRFLSEGGELSGYRFGNNNPNQQASVSKRYTVAKESVLANLPTGPDAYGDTPFYSSFNRTIGESIRGLVGDEWLGKGPGWQVYGAVGVIAVLGGLSGGSIFAAGGAWALGSTIVFGAGLSSGISAGVQLHEKGSVDWGQVAGEGFIGGTMSLLTGGIVKGGGTGLSSGLKHGSGLANKFSGGAIRALSKQQASQMAGIGVRLGVGGAGAAMMAGDAKRALQGDFRSGLSLVAGIVGGLVGTRGFRFCFGIDTEVTRKVLPEAATERLVQAEPVGSSEETGDETYVWLAGAIGGLAVARAARRRLKKRQHQLRSGIEQWLDEMDDTDSKATDHEFSLRTESRWSTGSVDEAICDIFADEDE